MVSLWGKDTLDAKQLVDKSYGKSEPAYSKVKYSFAAFRYNRTSTNVAPSSRPQR